MRMLTEQELSLGSEGYVRYCAGVAMVQYPEGFSSVHNVEDDKIEENVTQILATAEQLMIGGMLEVIRYASPPEARRVKRELEGHFDDAVPGMIEIVHSACILKSERLDEFNDNFKWLRPAPFLREQIYKHLCRGNYYELTTSRLLDDFVPDVRLIDSVRSRHPAYSR